MPQAPKVDRTVLYNSKPDIATITFNRPHHLNALTGPMVRRVVEALRMAEDDPEVKAVILTGAGSSFCVGEDLNEDLVGTTPLEFRAKILDYQALTKKIHDMKKVVIAEVNGYALGGGAEIAISCDLVFASEKAKFGFP